MSPLFQPTETRKKDTMDLQDFLISNPTSTYFVQVEGNEFEEYGISHNDILLVDKSRIHNKHQWYVVIYKNEFTLLPRTSRPQEDCQYWGAVTCIIKKT